MYLINKKINKKRTIDIRISIYIKRTIYLKKLKLKKFVHKKKKLIYKEQEWHAQPLNAKFFKHFQHMIGYFNNHFKVSYLCSTLYANLFKWNILQGF